MTSNLLAFATGLFTMTAAAGPTNSPIFQMRLVIDSEMPQAGASERFDVIRVDKATTRTNHEILYVEKTILLDQNDLQDTSVVTSELSGAPQIDITFTDEGRKHFAEVTRQNIGRRLAVIIGGQLYCAPVIQAELSGGRGVITGNFSEQEAKKLSNKINKAIKK
jgi:preprotein translocase subunit SecD